MVRSKNFFMKFYLALIIAFLYIPIAVLVVLSFNDSRSRVVWGGFTLEWYKTLFHNSDVVAALQNTLTIGFGSALIATVIGVLAAVGIDAMKKRSYSLTLAQCGYSDGYSFDALVFKIHQPGICQHFAGARHL